MRDARDVAEQAERAGRWPTASIFSPALEPLNCERVGAALALRRRRSRRPDPTGRCRCRSRRSARSAPMLPSTRSLPFPPSRSVGAVAAGKRVVAVAAVERQGRQRADAVLADDRVVAVEPLTTRFSATVLISAGALAAKTPTDVRVAGDADRRRSRRCPGEGACRCRRRRRTRPVVELESALAVEVVVAAEAVGGDGVGRLVRT